MLELNYQAFRCAIKNVEVHRIRNLYVAIAADVRAEDYCSKLE